ncbi:MAG: dTDP-4-dehydrorhamnose reductase [Bacteroidota bacterium]
MPQKILVTGAKGQIGQELQFLSTAFPSMEFIFTDKDELDLTLEDQVNTFFAEHQPNVCINCAAYTAVDKAETDIELCRKINKTAVSYLAQACKTQGTQLVHYSTDYVYHNTLNRPLLETDPTTPQGIYALTKLEGEQAATQCDAIIIRTSWVYSSYGHNFVKTMLRLGRERDQLSIVYDQIGAPTYARDIAQATLQIIEQLEGPHAGIYNFSNTGIASWYDLAKAIFEIEGINCKVSPIPSSGYPTPAKRPHFSVLDNTKIKAAFELEIAHWRDSVQKCLELLS